MVLTPAGERVLAASRRVLEELRRAEDELRVLGENGKGVLRLCTQCNTGYHWLPPLVQIFSAQVSRRRRADRRRRDAPADRGAVEGRIDLAIVTSAVDDKRVVTTPLFDDELVAVVEPEHPFARRAFIDPVDFAREHVILYNMDRRDSFIFAHILTPAGVEPARVSEVMLTEAILELVKAGMGVSVMARWAVDPAARAGLVRTVRITRRGILRTWSAARLRERPEPEWQREFVALLARQAFPARMDRARTAVRA